MKLRFSKPLFIYFSVSLILTTALISYGVWSFWKNGPANFDRMTMVYESTSKFEEVKNSNTLEGIKELVRVDRTKEATSEFEKFQNSITELNEIVNITEYETLSNNFSDLRKKLDDITTSANKSTLINVLRTKMIGFQNFVVHNQWRTLTRISNKIKTKISVGTTKSSNFYSYGNLKRLHASIAGDVDYMEKVTMRSVLSDEDKNLIVVRLGTLRTELNLLEKSLNTLRDFDSIWKTTNKSYLAWSEKFGPKLTYQKIELNQTSQTTLYGLVAIIGILVTIFAGGLFMFAYSEKRAKKMLEATSLDLIKDGVIPVKASLKGEWSHPFKEEIEKYRGYIHKRMSFGSIFQDAMPFSSLLLDSNLNAVWANSLFYEHWSIDSAKKDMSITWDYLSTFTNLGENDPVISAVRDGVAGIYQIQVKTENDKEAAPFEMYVSPVEYADQKRIMVIFYPLRSLEETLSNQMKSVVSPVWKSLDALIDDKFNGDFREKLQQDFSAAGIDNVYEKFTKVNDHFLMQKASFLKEIELLENNLFEQYKIIDDVRIIFEGQKDLQKDAINKFKIAKDKIVSVVEMRAKFEEMNRYMIEMTNRLFDEEIELATRSGEIVEIINENKAAYAGLVRSRDQFKSLKSQVELFRARSSQIIDQIQRGVASDVTVGKFAGELKEFNSTLGSFSKVSTQLDVGLSKVQIIMDSKEVPDVGTIKDTFKAIRSEINDVATQTQHLSRFAQEEDEELISSLRGLYGSFQNLRSQNGEIEHTVADSNPIL
ncbi:hypothetical protein M902_0432 [Bacteriovorax sp. BAL6_X]|uniref:hypothetical protein n=1 Tax=Bacteriovorax sp. BAL6_X TaxID=1201290 RepID=UPI000385F097|nr:hypothetical protein [Bacteriovorax sp. BAL6_X]EPZ50078.1 hypothetical protein M902_0432 [Bacteriovorax sp. BAL6_X]